VPELASKQGRGLSRPTRANRTPIDSLLTHAPDQTSQRPRLLHCYDDLAPPSQHHSVPGIPIFMNFRGSQSLNDKSVSHLKYLTLMDETAANWLQWSPTFAPEKRREDGARSICFFLASLRDIASQQVSGSVPRAAMLVLIRLLWFPTFAPERRREDGARSTSAPCLGSLLFTP
jgi:hypothetical protein